MCSSPAAGMELAERGATQVARSLSPMTSQLTRAEAGRLTALLERILGGDVSRRTVSQPGMAADL